MQKIKTFFRTNKSFLIKMCMFALIAATFIIHIPFTASAYSTYPYNVTISNPDNIPIDGSIQINYYNNGDYYADAFGSHTITRELLPDDVYYIQSYISDDGIHYFDLTSGVLTFSGLGYFPTGYYVVDYIVTIYDASVALALPNGEVAEYCGVIEADFGDLGVVGLYLVPNTYQSLVVEHTDFNFGDFQQYHVLRPIALDPEPEPTCPTLQEQIANYEGSWSSFVDMMQSSNSELYADYISTLYSWRNDGINSVTLADKIAEYEGSWNEFVGIIALNNVRLQTLYVNELTRVEDFAWDDGYTTGYDEGHNAGHNVGYTEGYANGLNKGQSENVTKNFFGNFINGVIDVVDHIHFYEEYNEKGEVTFYLSPWSIVLVVLMVAIVIIILKVFAGG